MIGTKSIFCFPHTRCDAVHFDIIKPFCHTFLLVLLCPQPGVSPEVSEIDQHQKYEFQKRINLTKDKLKSICLPGELQRA